MAKFLAKVGNAALLALLGYEVGDKMSGGETQIVKFESPKIDNSSKNEDTQEILIILALVLLLTVLVIGLFRLLSGISFSRKKRDSSISL